MESRVTENDSLNKWFLHWSRSRICCIPDTFIMYLYTTRLANLHFSQFNAHVVLKNGLNLLRVFCVTIKPQFHRDA